ncbi:uncharacterized protein JCM6883_000875 [Sporobolomyces salmoneus]|uniref:uncharacterized protein n=1 Tax=Sporobolomyces salmoneus TaxID=183962 RepID=UPI003170E783
MSNFTTPTTTSSTPGTTLSQQDSISSGRFFSSNPAPALSSTPQLGFAPPPPPSASTSNSAVKLGGFEHRPGLSHASSSEQRRASYSNEMVFLEDHNQATTSSGGGGGGATFLSDEETNASDSGSAIDYHRPPPPLPSALLPSSSSTSKGKGRATESPSISTTNETPSTGAGGTKKKAVPKTKKQSTGPDGKPIPRERKKKAGRACAACQKAHLTCDDGRPCKRCIKKGCPDDCVDGQRKKAKYLQEVPDELLERGRQAQGEGTPFSGNGIQLLQSPSAVAVRPSQSPIPPPQSLPSSSALPPSVSAPPHSLAPSTSQPIFDFSSTLASSAAGPSTSSPALQSSTSSAFYDTSSFLNNFASTPGATVTAMSSGGGGGGGLDQTQFGSEAANLEYAILSSMLNGNGFALDAHTPNLSGGIGGGGGSNNTFDPRFGTGGGGGAQNGRLGGEEMLLGGSRPDGTAKETPEGAGGGYGSFDQEKQGDTEMFSGEVGGAEGMSNTEVGRATYQQPPQQQTSTGSGVPGLMTAEEALRNVTKPYPYAQSYHYLVKHLKTRFEKNDILRIVRALATFRPSLIALQMPLTEEDETFVERTFQRTLVELHKLISFSGTPTVVWRRTGEICLVGTEFCLLTGWKREELVGTGNVNGVTTSGGGRAGGGKYIFELFDTASVVEYYESFAKHAFESTSTSVTLQCVVLGPDGRPVPCAFCFSVRRDLFSCPFLIIGSFLPILV